MEVYFKELQEICEYREGGIGKDFCIILKENRTQGNDPYFETDVTCYEANCPFNKVNSPHKYVKWARESFRHEKNKGFCD